MKNKSSKTVGAVVVQYNGGGKWSFVHQGEKRLELISVAPGGMTTAERIAKMVEGSIAKAGEITNVCRANIKQFIKRNSPPQYNVNDRGILT